ncbi:MAG: sigma-70 family RNA polymerase sigma factor [Agrobacterium cavarae]
MSDVAQQNLSSDRIFKTLRPKLVRLAYRMTGSLADAEDVVQAAFIRWQAVNHENVQSPEAYLRRIVTRLCLDAMRTIRRRREVYIGEWLPDPIIAEEGDSDEDEITMSLMLALERLSPLERAAFLLHDVFGATFEEVAKSIRRSPLAARQLASRARTNVRKTHRRYDVERSHADEIAKAFYEASRNGNIERLRILLAEDISLHADGGGQRPTIDRPIHGRESVLQILGQFSKRFQIDGSALLSIVRVNGLSGFVTREADGEVQTTALEIDSDIIRAIYVVRNPLKLRHLSML